MSVKKIVLMFFYTLLCVVKLKNNFNMEIKKLNWRDNVTDIGKKQGLFETLSDVKELGVTYHIRNYKYFGDKMEENKFYLMTERQLDAIECDNIEDAKLKAQEHFKQTVLKLFFD